MNRKNWIMATATFCVLCLAVVGEVRAQKVYANSSLERPIIDFGPGSGFPQRAVETTAGKKTISYPSSGMLGTENRYDGEINRTLYKRLEISGADYRGIFNWVAAYRACTDSREGGVTGWRLPTLRELQQIRLFQKAYELVVGMDDFVDGGSYWSATESSNYDAYAVNFDPPAYTTVVKNKGESLLVRCVRELP